MDTYFQSATDDLIDNGYNFDMNAYFTIAWHNFKQEPGFYIGYFIVYITIIMVLSLIPLVSLISSLLSPVLVIGFALVADKIQKRYAIEFADFFTGFNKNPGDLILVSIVSGLLILAVAIPGMVLFFALVPDFDNSENFTIGFIILGGIPLLLTVVCIVYLVIAWSWASYFVAFKNYKPWAAMELSRKVIHKNWSSFFGFYIVLVFLNLLGMMPCFLGLLITAPLSYIALYIAFEQITGSNQFDEIASIGEGIEHDDHDTESF